MKILAANLRVDPCDKWKRAFCVFYSQERYKRQLELGLISLVSIWSLPVAGTTSG